ncbi:MAG TPA: hypothetical protein VEU33_09665 [Archangium sp.]|nr:hypothetical protein [Archangium sp.]
MAVSLALILVSCLTARTPAAEPTGPLDLARHALVLEQKPDGQVAHLWIPLREFDLTKFQPTSSTVDVRRRIALASTSGLNAYCDGRHDQCVNNCLTSSSPFVIGHRRYMDTKARPWRIARSWWCPSNCMDAANECKKGRGEWAEQYAAEFDAIEPALDWLKKHRTELAVGTVVVIASVAFAVVAIGAGGTALVLAPLLLMTEITPGPSPENQLAEARR